MDPVLTNEQIHAIRAHPNGALRLVDPQTRESYVVIRAEVYEHLLVASLGDECHLSDTYAAQMQSALRAGWNDPAMDEYNNYDENFKKLCQ